MPLENKKPGESVTSVDESLDSENYAFGSDYQEILADYDGSESDSASEDNSDQEDGSQLSQSDKRGSGVQGWSYLNFALTL